MSVPPVCGTRCEVNRVLRTLAVLFLASPAAAVVVAPPPGESVVLLDERALLVFDPLTGTQTALVQHVFEGTSTPFGLLIPTPKPAQARVVADRVRRAVERRLHPQGRVQRTLDLEFVSWVGGCVLRDVGESVGVPADVPQRPRTRATASQLGTAPDPMHDWVLQNGFTLAPAQAAWLRTLQARGWAIVGVVVKPADDGGVPPARLVGPVLAITHAADEPVYAAGQPPFAIDAHADQPAPLELAVLTEWAVELALDEAPEPFFADVLTRREVNRMAADAGGLPWGFKRDGTLTAYRLPPTLRRPVMRLSRRDPRTARRPAPQPRLRRYRLRVPVEVLVLGVVLLVWAWARLGRRRRGRLAG